MTKHYFVFKSSAWHFYFICILQQKDRNITLRSFCISLGTMIGCPRVIGNINILSQIQLAVSTIATINEVNHQYRHPQGLLQLLRSPVILVAPLAQFIEPDFIFIVLLKIGRLINPNKKQNNFFFGKSEKRTYHVRESSNLRIPHKKVI